MPPFSYLLLIVLVRVVFSFPLHDEPEIGNDSIGTYVLAKVDNFDPQNNKTYKQYYKTSYEGNSELRVLYIGGEAKNEVRGHRLLQSSGNYTTLLKQLHAELNVTIFSLEHRYYDMSYPVHFPESAEDFKYLTSQQALADIDNFIRIQNKIQKSKWITIGGSYPGMLSLWFRQLYPNSAIGAIGSSAPVNSVVNFTSFMMVSQNGYKQRHPECHDQLKQAFQLLKEAWDRGDNELLDSLYPNLTAEFDYHTSYGIHNIMYRIVSDAYTQIQFDIDGICSNFNVLATDPLAEMAANFKDTADHIQDPEWRSWLWQVCKEFGFFYSPDDEECLAKGTYDINEVFVKECQLRFGEEFTYEKIEENVKKTNEFYGTLQPYSTSNVIITNSEFDPWSAQGVKEALGKNTKTFTIHNATHCDDLREGSNPDVSEARPLYVTEIKKWMKESSSSTNFVYLEMEKYSYQLNIQ